MTTLAGAPRAHPATTKTTPGGSRRALLFVVVAVTNLAGMAVAMWWSLDLEAPTYAAIAPDRDHHWAFLSLAAVNLAVGLPALAVAGMLLAPRRGAVAATVGGGLMWLGAGVYAAGVAGWAGAFFVATDPVALDPATGSALVERIASDPLRLWGPAGTGAGLVALGTVVLSVGLWRARSVPRWVPVVAAVSICLSFVLPVTGPVGLFVEAPIAISSIAIGWYAWRGGPGPA